MPLTSREENNSPPYDGSQGDGTNPTDSSPDPISLATGNNRVDETDVMIPCPVLPLELRRSYNSLCSAQAEPLGYGWHHGYDWQVGLISSVVATQPILKDGNIYLSDPSLTGVADIMPRVQTVTQTFLLVQAMCNLNEAPYKGDYLWFMRKADGSFLACNPQNNRYEARSVWGGGYQVLVPGGVVYTFGANGLLSSISHPCGVQVTLEYESLPGSKPQLRTVRHSNGKCLEFQYSGTRLARINTPDPSVYVEYVHNGAGDLTDVVRHGVAASNTFRYVYQEDGEHSRHWLVKRRNPVGEEFSYRYRADSRPTAPAVMSKGPAGEYSTWLDFPDKGHTTMTLERDGETLKSEFYYDPVFKLARRMVGPNNANREETHAYDARYCPTEHRFREGVDYVEMGAYYDEGCNPVQVGIGYNQSAVRNWQLSWNLGDKTLAGVIDPYGHTVTAGYTNSLINEIAVHGDTGAVYKAVFSYLPGGLLEAVTNANGNSVAYQYDGQGYVTNIMAGTDLWARVQYNAMGYATNVWMPGEIGVRSMSLNVDERGRPLVVTYPNGQAEHFAYDGLGHLTNHVDVAGRVSRYTYRVGELVKAERVFGDSSDQVDRIEIGYSQQMDTKVVKDPLGREVERYVLDAAGRTVAVTNLEGQSLSVTYGVLDFVKQLKRFDGSEVSFAYDGRGNLTNLVYPDGSLTYGYQLNGLLETAANEAVVVSNVYDDANRLVYVNSGVPMGELKYSYYPAGQVAEVTGPAGRTSYSNDALDRVSVISNAAGQFTFGYNAWNGRTESLSYPNGMTARYRYDVMDRLLGLEFRDASSNIARAVEYGYDPAGMITTNKITGGGTVDERRYNYDGLDRLTGETSLDETGGVRRASLWQYDMAGNRTNQVMTGSISTYSCSQANRLTAWTGGTAMYDAAGNTTNISYPDGHMLGLKWNSRYQLTGVTSTNGAAIESYGYDALGRRVWTAADGQTNWFIYDGMQVIAETDGMGALKKSYVYGPGIDNMLAMTVYGTATNKYYYLKDHLGSVLALADENGDIVESYRYDAWGRTMVFDGTGAALLASAVGNRICWQGREYSWKTGLYYFRARWYETITGRWLSNDPIGISGGLNQYLFAGNNPVNYRDPQGLCKTQIKFHDGDKYIQQYRRDLDKIDFNPYIHPFKFYDWSYQNGRDLRGTGKSFRFEGDVYGDSAFGNLAAARALKEKYGGAGATLFLTGANIMGFLQSWWIDQDGGIGKAYYDTEGRKRYQEKGLRH